MGCATPAIKTAICVAALKKHWASWNSTSMDSAVEIRSVINLETFEAIFLSFFCQTVRPRNVRNKIQIRAIYMKYAAYGYHLIINQLSHVYISSEKKEKKGEITYPRPRNIYRSCQLNITRPALYKLLCNHHPLSPGKLIFLYGHPPNSSFGSVQYSTTHVLINSTVVCIVSLNSSLLKYSPSARSTLPVNCKQPAKLSGPTAKSGRGLVQISVQLV